MVVLDIPNGCEGVHKLTKHLRREGREGGEGGREGGKEWREGREGGREGREREGGRGEGWKGIAVSFKELQKMWETAK